MKTNKLCLFTVALIFTMACAAMAQQKQKSAKEKAKTEKPAASQGENEQKVKDIIAFLEFMLNTIGSSATSARDKDVLITESYSKIFRDAKVQVEDDLDEQRAVITNKDVTAYLKDVDFFFSDVKFEFTIEDIKGSTMANGQLFYKVSLRRNLSGVTTTGKKVNNTKPRFIEVNYDPQMQDFRIVSIYTNEFDEKEALTTWWTELSYEWQSVFRRKLSLTDSVTLNNIKDMVAVEDLDLSGNEYILNIEPLARLNTLKLLDLSGTGITDLTPIRNLTELVELNLSGAKVSDLSPLKYSTALTRLNLSNTPVSDISVVEKMQGLQNLQMSATPVRDFKPIMNLTSLINLDVSKTRLSDLSILEPLSEIMELDLSGTTFRDMTPIGKLKTLQTLYIDSTQTTTLAPLSSLENLEVLSVNYTMISDLKPLQGLTKLQRVYCDQTPITRETANAFMAANPKVLVIFNSRDLRSWWETLPLEWQDVFLKNSGISADPSKEELARVTNLDSVNCNGAVGIYDLEPLRRLGKLRIVIVANTNIENITALEEHDDLKYLDISETSVDDLSVCEKLTKLKTLKADKTKIRNIEPLYNVKSLEKIYADHTSIDDTTARRFLKRNPDCLVVYKTDRLNDWWANLPAAWKQVLEKQLSESSREGLHRLVEMQTLQITGLAIDDLSPLTEFVQLRQLHLTGTAITSIPSTENIRHVKSLSVTNGPLKNIESLKQFTQLQDLDISNTAVEDLASVSELRTIRSINCAGTRVRRLDALKNLKELEILDCSNTLVSKLDPVMSLPLSSLKCFNTRVSPKRVEKFRQINPVCEVVYYR